MRAKRKQERVADEALRGVKRKPTGRPRKDHKWNDVAGEWFRKDLPDDHPDIVIAERRATLTPDSPDYPVWAALAVGTASDGLIDTSAESSQTYAEQHGSMHGTKVRSFVDRGAAESWLRSEIKSRKGAPSGTPRSQLKFRLKKRAIV